MPRTRCERVGSTQDFIRPVDTDGDEHYVRLANIADIYCSRDENDVTILVSTTASSINSTRSGLARPIVVDAATAAALGTYREARSDLR